MKLFLSTIQKLYILVESTESKLELMEINIKVSSDVATIIIWETSYEKIAFFGAAFFISEEFFLTMGLFEKSRKLAAPPFSMSNKISYVNLELFGNYDQTILSAYNLVKVN